MISLRSVFNSFSKRVPTHSLKDSSYILKSFVGNDYKQYANYNFKGLKHTRSIVGKNDIIEMIVMVWPVGSECPDHLHPDGGCLMTVVEGELIETTTKSVTTLKKFEYKYIDNSIGSHKICNTGYKNAVSIHIYATK
jgi:hypothetical protein